MTTRFADHLLTGDHASRPVATAVPDGTLYACSDHDLIYQSDGAVWATWIAAGAGASALDDLSDVDTTGQGSGDVLTYDGADWVPQAPAGGATVQRPPLVPGTPLDDFDAATLDVAYSANSSGGSFATTDCITQARYGSHLRMMYQEQMGALYRAHGNVDLDYQVGGMRALGLTDNTANTMAFGIAALTSAGTGVGVLVSNDGNSYLAGITTWQFTGALQTFTNRGAAKNPAAEFWLRLIRVTNAWTAHVSLGGKSWGTASASSSSTITVDRIAVGLFYNTGALFSGALEVDWLHV